MIRVHLDTDLGSDTDDLCALAMLLGWPGVVLTGITTTTDPGGIRAGFVRYALGLAARADVPVVAGAEGSLGGLYVPLAFPDHWPEPIDRSRLRPGRRSTRSRRASTRAPPSSRSGLTRTSPHSRPGDRARSPPSARS